MPLTHGRPGQQHDSAVQSQLSRIATAPPHQLNALAGSAPAELEMVSPQPVYTLGLDQVVAGAELSTAVPTGWRYLLQQGNQTVAAAETLIDDGGGAAFAQFNSGPFVPTTAEALGRAEQYAGGTEEELEPRLLRVPALYAMALWLHGPDGHNDVVLPIAPTPPGIEAGRSYSVDDYLAALREVAAGVEPAGPGDMTGG